MQAAPTMPVVPVGKIKSLGKFGEPYEVGQPLRPIGNGDWMVKITLIKSGEVTEYRLSRLLTDPDAV